MEELRKIYSDPFSLEKLDTDEKALRQLIAQKSFASDPIVLQIVSDASKKIEEINYLLSYDMELNKAGQEYVRFSLYNTREVWQFIIDRFSFKRLDSTIETFAKDFEKEIDRLEQ